MYKLKKILSVFVISVLILTATVGTVPINMSAETITTAYIEGTDVRVRSTPSTASASSIIEEISNTSATVLSSVTNAEGTWYQITYHNGTRQVTGYIFYDSSYIRIVKYNPDAAFEEKIKAFPSSYQTALKSLHAAYPNWEFIPDPVALSFTEAVYQEGLNSRKQVSKTQSVSWRSMSTGSYNWNTGSWVFDNGGYIGASREIIAYYMDPRNFLNSSGIFQFLEQGYNASRQNKEGLKKIVAGTFLAGTFTEGGKTYSYVDVIMEAAIESKTSPYVLAAKIIQEQGVEGKSSLITGTYSGYKNLYNYFNVGASGTTETAVIVNGLERAKKEGWTTRTKALIDGAKFLSNNYISAGQDTYYYQDFNVHNPDSLWHQYAQAVYDAHDKGVKMAEPYTNDKNSYAVFKIPVYTNMPSTVSPKPVVNSKTNNYYFSNISNVTPTFSMFNYDYSLYVTGNTNITATPVKNATYEGYKSFSLKKGNNTVTLKVKSETGYIMEYVINVTAEKDCTLTVNGGGGATAPATPSTTIKGDTNGDGKITIRDLANVRLHLLGITLLKGNNLTGADTNKDGKVTIRDLANVRLHLLGITKLY